MSEIRDLPPGSRVLTEQEVADLPAKLFEEIHRLQKERSELKAALKAAQWGACDTCGWHCYCPACKGRKPDPDEDPEVEHGHKPDCVVGKALGARGGA